MEVLVDNYLGRPSQKGTELDQALTPRDVLRQVAQAIPEDVRSDIIIVGSLAAAYQLLRDSGQVVTAITRVLSDENMALLKALREQQPDSRDSLAKVVGKQAPNVSRSLHTLAEYGLAKFIKKGRSVTPRATFEHLSIDLC